MTPRLLDAMLIKSAEFIKSSPDLKICPSDKLPELAFIGRSNVGKSSFINLLTRKDNLAKTSSTPGKTRYINHFLINGQWYLVDLPGYGYAKISRSLRTEFHKATLEYLARRETLYCVFVLIDVRLEPQAIDLRFLNWLGEHEIPSAILFTKSDKISEAEANKNVRQFCTRLLETWETLPPWFKTSSVNKEGRDEVLEFIEKCLNANILT